MKRSGLFVSLLLAIILSNPAAEPVFASTAIHFRRAAPAQPLITCAAAAEEVTIASEPAKVEETKTVTEIAKHTVKAGDSLWRIAQQLLGDGTAIAS